MLKGLTTPLGHIASNTGVDKRGGSQETEFRIQEFRTPINLFVGARWRAFPMLHHSGTRGLAPFRGSVPRRYAHTPTKPLNLPKRL
jgi:hypothetical protein